MPEKTEEKIEKKKGPMVELDTSGPGADVELPEDRSLKQLKQKWR